MRKRLLSLCLSVVLLICMLPSVGLPVSAATAQPIVRYCEYCDLTETWQPLTDKNVEFTTGHYYLTTNIVFSKETIASGNTVCLDLNGRKYTGNRHMILESGAILNVQGNGTFIGRGIEAKDPGGAVWIQNGAVMNFYNGTLAGTAETRGTNYGGVLGVYGTFNMYGGTIKDGIAEQIGGNVFVDSAGTFNMYGGSITGGTAPDSPCVYAQGKVLLANDASIDHIQLTPNPSANVCTADQLTIQGAYTGSVSLSPYGVTEADKDVGNSINADLSNANIYFKNSDLKLAVSGTDLVTYLPKTADIVENGTVLSSHDTLSEAIQQVQESQQIVLQTDTTEAVTVDKNITLDLNGRTIANTLTAAEGVTVQVMDSATADYNIGDSMYGKIQATSGDIRGAEATQTTVPYLKIVEDDGVSFHAVSLNIDSVTLRPGEAALSYNNTFNGDALVKANISSFGVALSVVAPPETEIMGTDARYTSFEATKFAPNTAASSSLLTNIMRTKNDNATNRRNAELPVYGRAYIQLTDGSYLFGCCRTVSLREVLEKANADFANLSGLQRDGLLRLYNAFPAAFDRLGLSDLKDTAENYEENTLKVIVLGNSHSVDAFRLLDKVFKDQNPDQNIVLGVMYYSGCSIKQHVNFAKDKSPVYDYRLCIDGTWVNNKESTLQDGLTDQQWDLVVMQAGTSDGDSTFNKSGRDELARIVAENISTPYKLVWHMTWASPNDETFYAAGFDPQPPATWRDRYDNLYNFDYVTYLSSMLNNVKTHILPDPMYDIHVGVGSAIAYAHLNLGIPQTELYRDYTHLSDFGRLIASYCWYSQLTGKEITQINIDLIPAADRATYRQQALGDLVVTEEMKDVIIRSANYVLNEENRWSVPVQEAN